MSSGLELQFIEYTPGAWYWIRQSGFCPVEHWDWREHEPDVVGPFATYETADASYCEHERNAGGHSINPHHADHATDKTLAQCIASAEAPDKRYRW